MYIRLFAVTTLFTFGALVLTSALWLLTSQPDAAQSSSLAHMLSQSLLSAGLSGLLVDGLRLLAQKIWPTKKKPKLALQDVLNANLG